MPIEARLLLGCLGFSSKSTMAPFSSVLMMPMRVASSMLHVLPPYTQSKTESWYKGTANAIYQNIPFVDRYNPEYVAVLGFQGLVLGEHPHSVDAGVDAVGQREINDAVLAAEGHRRRQGKAGQGGRGR